MKRLLVLTTAMLLGVSAGSEAQVLLVETFDDGDASTRWSAPVVESEAGVFDGTVDFAFDYGALGLPAAPGGGDSVGLFMESNLTDNATSDQGEGIGVTSLLASLPNAYKLTMDVYYNVDADAGGSTEYGIFGVHASGANFPDDEAVNDDVSLDFELSDGDGLAWQATGEGGASNDLHLYEDPGNMDAGSQTGLGGYEDIPDGSVPGVPTGDAGSLGPQGQWVEVSIEKFGDTISWRMNGFELDSVDNSDNRYSGGTIMVGYSDVFNSVADISAGTDAFPNFAHFIVFDNVQLVVPEPGGGLLLGLGSVACAFARRRRS